MPQIQMTSFEQIRESGVALRALLAREGITLNPTSVIAEALEHVDEAIGYFKARLRPTPEHEERLLTDLVAIQILGLVAATAAAAGSPVGLSARLHALTGGDPRLASEATRSADRDAIFELLCWHICKQFATDVVFDESPDIQCTFEGHRFGLACKAVYGEPDTAATAVRKGRRQLRRSPVEFGLVVVHLTNHFVRATQGELGALLAPDAGTLEQLIEARLRATARPIERSVLRQQQSASVTKEPGFHGVLFGVHALARIGEGHFLTGRMLYQGLRSSPPQVVLRFIDSLNEQWQFPPAGARD